TDDELREDVNTIRDHGMEVIFKLNVRSRDRQWKGMMVPENDDWDTLFDSYRDFVMHYKDLVKELNIPIYCIATEQNSMMLPNWRGFGVPNPDERWRKIIDEVKADPDFHSKLTISTDFNQAGNLENMNLITYWDALDLISFEPYAGLTGPHVGNEYSDDPSIDELRQGFRSILENYIEPLVARTGLDVYVSEMGWQFHDGQNYDPTRVLNLANYDETDLQEAGDIYAVVLEEFRNRPWFLGFVYWNTEDILTDGAIGFKDRVDKPLFNYWYKVPELMMKANLR
ncbi:MAG: hypothetical protein ACE5G1_11515, partial [bacterium]